MDALETEKSEYYVPREVLAHFCLGGISQMVLGWVQKGMVESYLDMTKYLVYALILTINANTGTTSLPKVINEFIDNRDFKSLPPYIMDARKSKSINSKSAEEDCLIRW